jgi:hypothetical protein
MSKHTPGPWEDGTMSISKRNWALIHDGAEINIVKRGADVIAAVWCGDDEDGEEAANARLIAAAPELLEALEGLYALAFVSLAVANHGGPETTRIMQTARAVIAKAKGE